MDGKTDRIEYQVVVNPARKDLSVGTTKAKNIELWDDVTARMVPLSGATWSP